MTSNNPFISYKIYSTPAETAIASIPSLENVRVACVVFTKEEELLPFLKKVLSAAQIPEDEFRIILLKDNQQVSAAEQKWFDKLEHILCFGIQPDALDVHIPQRMYSTIELHHTKIIQLPLLQKISADKAEKQKLWQLLQKEFLDD